MEITLLLLLCVLGASEARLKYNINNRIMKLHQHGENSFSPKERLWHTTRGKGFITEGHPLRSGKEITDTVEERGVEILKELFKTLVREDMDLRGSGSAPEERLMDYRSSGEAPEERLMDYRSSGEAPEERLMDYRSSGEAPEERLMDYRSSGEAPEERLMDYRSSGEAPEERLMDYRSSGEAPEERLMDYRSSGEAPEERLMDYRSSGEAPEERLVDLRGSGDASEERLMDLRERKRVAETAKANHNVQALADLLAYLSTDVRTQKVATAVIKKMLRQ